MKGHFDYAFYEMPSYSPHFGPFERGFGSCGRGMPPFGINGWPHFGRPRGPPGFDRSPDRYGPPHYEAEYYGPSPPQPREGGRHGPRDEVRYEPRRHDSHRSLGCRHRGPRDDHHGSYECKRHGPPGHHDRPRCGRSPSPGHYHGFHQRNHHGSPGRHENRDSSSECGRRGPPKHDYECHRRCGSRDHSPRRGMPREHCYEPTGCGYQGPSGHEHKRYRRSQSPVDHHGPHHRDHHGPPGCSRHGARENRDSSPEHGRRAKPNHDHECHREHGQRDHSPGRGPRREHHQQSWLNVDHHGFGPRGSFGRPEFGPDYHFGPRFDHRMPHPCDRPGSPSRDCEECRKRHYCSGNRDNHGCNKGGRKENRPCYSKDKDQNVTGDTVLVQRIVVERAPARPQSV